MYDHMEKCLAMFRRTIREGHRANDSTRVCQETDMNRSTLVVSAFLVVLTAAEAFSTPVTEVGVSLQKAPYLAGGTIFGFQVTGPGAPVSPIWLGDQASAYLWLTPEDHNLVELPTPGWSLSDIQVTGIPYDLITDGVTLHVGGFYGGVQSVIFVNEPVPTVPVPGAALLSSIGVAFVGWLHRRRTL